MRLFPNHVAGEGHFMAKLHKADGEVTAKPIKLAKSNVTAEQQKLWDAFANENLTIEMPNTLITFGDQLYAIPEGTPRLNGLQVLRAGLHLGTFKKKRFEPSLALALALKPVQFKQSYALTMDEWQKYVHGDTFMIEKDESYANGWYILTMAENGVGFGKLVNGQMKNFYPKGLRFIAQMHDK